MENIAGRNDEIALLESLKTAQQSAFVAVYGRRRVGKTYLIRTVFENQFCFHTTFIRFSTSDLSKEVAPTMKTIGAIASTIRVFVLGVAMPLSKFALPIFQPSKKPWVFRVYKLKPLRGKAKAHK